MDVFAYPDWSAFGWHAVIDGALMAIIGLVAFWFHDLTHQTEAARMVGGPPRYRRALLAGSAPVVIGCIVAMPFSSLYPGRHGLIAGVIAAVIGCALIGAIILALRRFSHKYRALENDFLNANRAPGGGANWSREQ
jgi:ABC-type uncharacterized transport system permease subunit